MTLASGTRLGPYEIVAPIGAGGMGEVYRARDTRLEREVAVKILPAGVAQNAQLKVRFEREAKTISQLSHPNICTLFDVGENYLVMELLEGETLADRTARRPLPLPDVLKYGAQIAEALGKAHRAGVIHRDVKPGNVMITKGGAKLLDFGLARSSVPALVADGATVQKPLTQEGTILGTYQYMAPEQLAGDEPDARTDIFALGAVLYEMATGKRAFEGKTKTSLIGAIVSGEPKPISEVQPLTPPVFEHVVKKCLAKEPDDRWQNAADIAEQLRWISQAGSQAGVAAPIAHRRQLRTRASWLLNVVLMLAAAALTWGIIDLRREPPRVIHASILPPQDAAFLLDGFAGPMVLSPDGKRIAFVARSAGKNLLWVRPLDAEAAQPLAGTEGAAYPFWSPDGRYLGFFAAGQLKKIDAVGGPAQPLCNVTPLVRGGTWSADGVIVFSPGVRDALSRVSEAGGTPAPVTQLDRSGGEYTHRFPHFLPDGRHFLYTSQSFSASLNQNKIYVGSIDGKENKFLLTAGAQAVYVPSGFILFLRERTLMAQRFDPTRLELSGEARPVAENIEFFPSTATAIFDAASDGTLAYQSGGTGSLSQLVWIDRSGKELGKIGDPADIISLRLSNRGDRVVYSQTEAPQGSSNLWVLDLARNVSTRFTFDSGAKGSSVWSPDDKFIAYTGTEQRFQDIIVKASDGVSPAQTLFHSPSLKFVNDWSADGRYILFQILDPRARTSWQLWTLDVAKRVAAPYLQTTSTETQGNFSPDGKWIAYTSDESGAPQVYVQPFPAGGGKWQISINGGAEPRWSRDGKQIFFTTPVGNLESVSVETAPRFAISTPTQQAPMRSRTGGPSTLGGAAFAGWAVTADAQRFLINQPIKEEGAAPITIVTNWAAQLKK